MTKQFMTSVGRARFYNDSDGTLIFSGTTLMDTTFDFKVSNTDVRGDYAAPLLYVFWHSPEATIAITEATFNLEFLAACVGSAIGTGKSVFGEDSIVLDGSKGGTLTKTPLALPGGSTVYAWITHIDGSVEKVICTGSAFTSTTGSIGEKVCVRYYYFNSAAQFLTIASNVIPKIGRLVIETQLNDSDASTNKVGVVEITIPRAIISGSFNLNMKMDQVASTPVSARALRSEDLSDASCTTVPVLATIAKVLDSAHWYDGIHQLAIYNGDQSLATTLGTLQLQVYAVPSDGRAAFLAPVADLTFVSGTPGKASVGAHTGLVQGVATGTTLINVSITAAPTVDASATITVP